MLPFLVSAGINLGMGIYGANQTASSNRAARSQAKKQNKYNQEMYDWNWDEEDGQMFRKYRYDQESVNLQRRNAQKQLSLAEQNAMDEWSYGMTIRDFQHNTQLRIRDQQIRQANQQFDFNEQAIASSLVQQDNWFAEQRLGIQFQEMDMENQYLNSQRDSQISQGLIDQKQRGARAAGQLNLQRSVVEGLKAEGQARAKGQAGRTAVKNVQAAIAENGAEQAAIAEQVTQAGEQYKFSTAQNIQSLQKAYDRLFLQKQQLGATMTSLNKKNLFARQELRLQKQQADANAYNKIMIKPELAPDLPIPPDLDLYKPIFQDPFEPEAPPRAPDMVAPQQSVLGSFLNNGGASAIMGGISGLASMSTPQVPQMNLNAGAGQFNGSTGWNSGLYFNN